MKVYGGIMKNKIFLLLVVLTLVFCFLSACGDKNPAKTKHEHSLVLVDEVEATEESEGQRAHYICSDCGEIYLDPRGKHPATQEELITDKLAHVHSLA